MDQALIYQGLRGLFHTCDLLVHDLLAAKRELKLIAMLKKLLRLAAPIIDVIDYIHQSREETEVLFSLLANHYERGSIMVRSNLPFSEC